MKTRSALFVLAFVWLMNPVHAHRLDEFLQATTIAVEKDRVVAQLRLTPGIEVSRAVLADLDPDGNGVLSEEERRAYAERVQRDLSLTVDGSQLSLRLVSSTFPSVGEIREGVGEILLTFAADVPPGGTERRLVFENHHQSGLAVYLVNCLVPGDPDLRITAQNRNFEQSFFQLDYTQTNISPVTPPATVPPPRAGYGSSAPAGRR